MVEWSSGCILLWYLEFAYHLVFIVLKVILLYNYKFINFLPQGGIDMASVVI